MGERVLIFVRHGQYCLQERASRYGLLTSLGETQARKAAHRLAEYPVHAIYSSTVQRATQTADLIRRRLGDIPHKRCHVLREGIPSRFGKMTRAQLQRVPKMRARMDRAYLRFFRATRGPDRCEVFVCHGNIIRYLVRKAIGDAPGGWWRAWVMHCSLSVVVIRRDGSTRLMALNDVGHLPRKMQTLT